MPQNIKTKFIWLLAVSILIAFGFLSSDKVVTASENPQTTATPKYALLVGISNYQNGKPGNIDGCVNNVDLLRAALVEWGFPDDPAHIVTLKNEQATYKGITGSFRSHLTANAAKAKAAGKEATIVYYFCGHGSQFPNAVGDDEENDGMDETFVAWDSRAPGAFDILDDEMADLRYDLAKQTSSTTLIFESCHSGTGSRGPVRGMDTMKTGSDARKRSKYVRKNSESKLEPDQSKYVEIAAAHSSLEALSESAAFAAPEKPYGLMTKALVQSLNAARISGIAPTYRELIRDIQNAVSTGKARSEQSPQLEGDRDRVIFGETAEQRRAAIEVSDPNAETGSVVIKAGAIHGLRPGAQISFYQKGSKGTGTDGWISNGIVESVRSFDSDVSVTTAAKVDRNSNAVLSSAGVGGGAIYLDLPANELNSQIRTSLENDIGIFKLGIPPDAIVAKAQAETVGGVLRIGKAKTSEIFADHARPGTLHRQLIAPIGAEFKCNGTVLEKVTPELRFPLPSETVYYVYDGEPGSPPLFGRTFRADDADLAAKLTQVIRARAFQQNIQTLEFKNSSIQKYLSVTVESISATTMTPLCTAGRLQYKRLPADTVFTDITSKNFAKAGSYIRVRIKNISGDVNRLETGDKYAAGLPLHFTVVAMTNDGSVRTIYGSTGADQPLDDGKEATSRVMSIDLPATATRFAVFASRQYVDFSFLEVRKVERSGPILSELFAKTGARGESKVFSSPADWGVVHYELKIKE
jgi:hypothetical protein